MARRGPRRRPGSPGGGPSRGSGRRWRDCGRRASTSSIHDVALPGIGNVDRVALGGRRFFSMETKSHWGHVTARGGVLLRNGRPFERVPPRPRCREGCGGAVERRHELPPLGRAPTGLIPRPGPAGDRGMRIVEPGSRRTRCPSGPRPLRRPDQKRVDPAVEAVLAAVCSRNRPTARCCCGAWAVAPGLRRSVSGRTGRGRGRAIRAST